MIKVIANSVGDGDWITVLGHNDEVLSELHKSGPQDILSIFKMIDIVTELVKDE